MLRSLLTRLRAPGPARTLYFGIVAAAREPALFAALGVPDTFDGRFDLVLLHAALVFRRLRGEGAAAVRLADDTFDVMCADFDRSLREYGVGDSGIGRRVKAMAKAFYGRAQAYDRALGGEAPLEEALRRNLFAGGEPSAPVLMAAVAYVRAWEGDLSRTPLAQLAAGTLPKPMVAAASRTIDPPPPRP